MDQSGTSEKIRFRFLYSAIKINRNFHSLPISIIPFGSNMHFEWKNVFVEEAYLRKIVFVL